MQHTKKWVDILQANKPVSWNSSGDEQWVKALWLFGAEEPEITSEKLSDGTMHMTLHNAEKYNLDFVHEDQFGQTALHLVYRQETKRISQGAEFKIFSRKLLDDERFKNNREKLLTKKDVYGETPLHVLMESRDGPKKVRSLLQLHDKEDWNIRNNSGETPLSKAMLGGRSMFKAVERLVGNDAVQQIMQNSASCMLKAIISKNKVTLADYIVKKYGDKKLFLTEDHTGSVLLHWLFGAAVDSKTSYEIFKKVLETLSCQQESVDFCGIKNEYFS